MTYNRNLISNGVLSGNNYAVAKPNYHNGWHTERLLLSKLPDLLRRYQKTFKVVPWKKGKLLIWDATCPNTFASSYSPSATREAGAVAALAEERKTAKYAHLNPTHAFTPVAIETSGVFGPQTMAFLKELGQRLAQASGDERSTTYLFQRLSVAVQRGNSASVLGTTGQLPGQDFLF